MGVSIKKQIPNLLTATNLVAGCFAIYNIMLDKPYLVLGCVFVSLISDFLDGFSARMLNVQSDIGKELDSLADVVSFGAVPAFIAVYLLERSTMGAAFSDISFLGFLIAAFSAFRLAKFNLDSQQTDDFMGLATPANCLFWLGLLCWHLGEDSFLQSLIRNPYLLVLAVCVTSILLVVPIRMFSFKAKHPKKEVIYFRLCLLIIAALLLFLLKLNALALIGCVYLLLSIIYNITYK